jgi:hypothetical protein
MLHQMNMDVCLDGIRQDSCRSLGGDRRSVDCPGLPCVWGVGYVVKQQHPRIRARMTDLSQSIDIQIFWTLLSIV